MERQVEYYKNLYTSEDTCQDTTNKFLTCIENKLSENNKNIMEQDITKEEANKAVNLMKCNKSPGPDGITVEFYKSYWNIIGDELIQVYQNSFITEELPYT